MNGISTKDSSTSLSSQLIMETIGIGLDTSKITTDEKKLKSRIFRHRLDRLAWRIDKNLRYENITDEMELRRISCQRILDRVMENLRNAVYVGWFLFFWWAFWYYFSYIESRRRSFANW